MKALESLATRSKLLVAALAFVLIGLVGLLDFLTGPEFSFSIFYLIPISIAIWFVNSAVGTAASTLGALTWLLVDLVSGRIYSQPLIPYWNAIVRFGFFVIITLILTALRAAIARREEMQHFVVHDLRAPLSFVQSSLQLIRDTAVRADDEDVRNLISMSIASCNRMTSLIDSLLDLARLESRKMPLQAREVDIRGLLEDALQQVSAMSGRSNVGLEVHVESGLSAIVADYEVSLRILVNLFSNAIKHSPAHTTVTTRARRHGDQMIAFAVTDQGAGIPEVWQDKVFDKFAQVDVRRAGIGTGSGLGLTFCRMAVEAQGGRIWLDSKVGEGTTMTFTLPKARGGRS